MMRISMVLKQNIELLDYWNLVRQGRQAPKRIEITPSAISHILPTTFILEVRNQETLHFRLAGSKMCEMFAQDFRGENFLNCWPLTERKILVRHIPQLIVDGAVIHILCDASAKEGHKAQFEILFLPMTHGSTTIDRILGSIVPTKDYPWLGVTKLEFQEIKEIHMSYLRGSSLPEPEEKAPSELAFIPHKKIVEGKNCQFRVFDGGKTDQSQ